MKRGLATRQKEYLARSSQIKDQAVKQRVRKAMLAWERAIAISKLPDEARAAHWRVIAGEREQVLRKMLGYRDAHPALES